MPLSISFLMNKVPTIIFGGSFDPVHVGHLALATEACNRDLASEVWFMLSPLNPHKVGRKITAEDKRLHMLQLAVEGNARFKASDFELSLPRPSYTVNTLMALEEAFPEREFDSPGRYQRLMCFAFYQPFLKSRNKISEF